MFCAKRMIVVPARYLPPLRYFTLFMNLLNDCSEPEDDGQQVAGCKRGMSRRLASLRHCTVLAMSNLLNANVDSGLMHSIGEPLFTQHRWRKIYGRHPSVAALFSNIQHMRHCCLFTCWGVNCINYLKNQSEPKA